MTMVVQIDACRFTSAAIPLEDEPPLFVDADRMEAFQIATQLLEVVEFVESEIEKWAPVIKAAGVAPQ